MRKSVVLLIAVTAVILSITPTTTHWTATTTTPATTTTNPTTTTTTEASSVIGLNNLQFFGPQDMLDVTVTVTDDPNEQLNVTEKNVKAEAQKANKFIKKGNTVHDLLQRNTSLNQNYLIAEKKWGPPKFRKIKKAATLGFSLAWPCFSWTYHCPWNWNLLWVFQHHNKICFIPWAIQQQIYYAQCLCTHCLAPFNGGTCVEGCCERRNVLAVCVGNNNVGWHYITLVLPKCCACRTC